MVEFNINNLTGNTGGTQATGTNFDALLNLARGQLENISKQVQTLINSQSSFNPSSLLLDAAGVKVQVPQLANLITGQQDILLKTPLPLDKNQNLSIQVSNSNVVLNQGRPVLQLQGQILQNNITPQRFTAEIPLQSLANQNPQISGAVNNTTIQNTQPQNTDQVVRSFLPTSQVQAFTNNLSETIRPVLPQNLQNINLGSQNNLNIQINSFITPSGEQIIVNQNLTNQNPGQQIPANNPLNNTQLLQVQTQIPTQPLTQPQTQSTIQTPLQPQQLIQGQQVIQGQVEIFPDANEALIRTEFGTFRVSNLTQLPNGSQINFTIQGQTTLPNQPTNNILNLNPTNIQALRLSLEATDSPLQNLIRILNSTQGLAPLVQRFIPHPDDKAAYAKQLLFLSGSAKGAPEGWLGDDGQLLVNKLAESDTNLNRLQEVFGVLRNFSGHGQQLISTEWNSYIIPFFDGSKLSFVTIQVQRDPEGNQQHNTKGKRKFIMELEQDDLGRVAIEGMYSKVEGKVNNLDIVLKTEKDVDDSFRNELIAIFNDTATAYGFTGSLNFSPFTTSTPIYTDISKILGDGIII